MVRKTVIKRKIKRKNNIHTRRKRGGAGIFDFFNKPEEPSKEKDMVSRRRFSNYKEELEDYLSQFGDVKEIQKYFREHPCYDTNEHRRVLEKFKCGELP